MKDRDVGWPGEREGKRRYLVYSEAEIGRVTKGPLFKGIHCKPQQ